MVFLHFHLLSPLLSSSMNKLHLKHKAQSRKSWNNQALLKKSWGRSCAKERALPESTGPGTLVSNRCTTQTWTSSCCYEDEFASSDNDFRVRRGKLVTFLVLFERLFLWNCFLWFNYSYFIMVILQRVFTALSSTWALQP